jgi:hypothetical protein
MSIYFAAIDADDMPVSEPEFGHYWPNVGRGNQALVISALGFTPDERGDDYGVCGPTDFRGRVLMAMALSPADAGVPATSDRNRHDMGRREGYLEGKLAELLAHAEWCAANRYRVQWA